MKMESRALRPLARRLGWTLVTTGIGGQAIRRAAEASPDGAPLILAGVAGALSREVEVGSAYLVSEVFTSAGVLASPVLAEGLRVTGADDIVATPQDKQALANRTGAHLVDMESHDFAEAAEQCGRRWAIVRGVSDGLDHHLPPGCDQWFSTDGGLRLTRAAVSLAGRPRQIPSMIAFAGRTRAAMQSVRRLIAEVAHTVTAV